MKATPNKLILRYRPEDLDQHLNKFGMVKIINSLNVAEYVSETAVVVSSSVEGIEDGDEVIVQKTIGWDTDYKAEGAKKRNQYFIEKLEDGSELRFCYEDNIFGVRRNGRIVPTKPYVFAELPEKPYEYKGLIHIPEIYRKQDTDNKGYRAKIKYIREDHKEEYGLKEGDMIWAEKNSDAVKTCWTEKLLRIPIKKLLAVE